MKCNQEYLNPSALRKCNQAYLNPTALRHLTRKSRVLGSILAGNILSFLLPLFQEEQLSVTGESMSTKYWVIA